MPFGDLADNGQPGPGSLNLAPHRTLEQLEDTLGMFGCDSRSAITNNNAYNVAIFSICMVGCNLDLGGFAFLGKFQGIQDKIIDGLGGPHPVNPDLWKPFHNCNVRV